MKRQRNQSVAGRNDPPAAAPAPRGAGLALLIFGAAAAVRLLHVFQIRHAPFFTMLMGDARGYDAWAQRIAGGEWMGGDVFYQAPLYPYFLGTIYTFAGRDLLTVRLVQALVGASSCALLGLAATRLFSKPAGLVAGLALALYAPAIFFDGLIQKSVLDVFFMCLALWLISRIITLDETSSNSATVAAPGSGFSRLWLSLGLTMGALALTRENAFVLVVVIVIWSLTRTDSPARSPGLRWRVKETTAFLVGLAIVLAPVAIRNYAVGGGFYLTTSQFGPNFYIGNNPKSDGTYMSLRFGRGAPEYERQDATELAEHALGRRLTPAEVSGYWTDRAMGFITSQPAAWVGLLGRKFRLLWNADEMLDTESQETYAEWSAALRFGSWIGHFGVLTPLALLGAWLLWPERRRLWILYGMTLAYAASVVFFYVFARYRFPLVPFLILFAAGGVAKVWVRFGRDQRSFTGAGAPPPARSYADASAPASAWPQALAQLGTRSSVKAVLLVAVIVFTNWPILSKSLMQAITENNLAVAFQEDGQLDRALEHYQRSLTHRPDYAPAYNNMGAALRAAGRLDEAVASYRRALESQPDYPDAHYNLANALLEQKRPDEAAAHFRVALAAIPDSAGSHNNLGIALAAEGKLEESVVEFRAALQADPDSPKTNRNLGKALSDLGRSAEAIGYLRRAIALDPMDKEAHYDLGSDLLNLNQMAEAASEFQAALKIDPDWVTAHNNLGIALASLDRLDDAILHFRRALEIQPEFADAKRNLATALAQKRR